MRPKLRPARPPPGALCACGKLARVRTLGDIDVCMACYGEPGAPDTRPPMRPGVADIAVKKG